MKFEIYQWLVPLISVIFIFRTLRQHHQHRRTLRGTLIWATFWTVLAVFAVIPNYISQNLAVALGFKSNINAVIFLGLGGLYIFVFFLSATVNRLENRITELVRELAKERGRKGENR